MDTDSFRFYKKKDRIVIAVLIVIILGFILFFHYGSKKMVESNPVSQQTRADSIIRQAKHQYYQVKERVTETFVFDPNTADSVQFLRLGLQPWQVRNIYKYRAAGGVYRKPEDFARLYGLTKKDYLRLKPFIRISDDYQSAAEFVKNDRENGLSGTGSDEKDVVIYYDTKIKDGETVSLSSDTTELQKVPGIGPYFARKIYQYGKLLGGYVSTEQLLEIEDFPEESLKYFTPSEQILKINVNTATVQQLRRHPYINFYQAKEFVEYHRLNGPLKSLDDLRFSRSFTQKDFDRIAPYVEF